MHAGACSHPMRGACVSKGTVGRAASDVFVDAGRTGCDATDKRPGHCGCTPSDISTFCINDEAWTATILQGCQGCEATTAVCCLHTSRESRKHGDQTQLTHGTRAIFGDAMKYTRDFGLGLWTDAGALPARRTGRGCLCDANRRPALLIHHDAHLPIEDCNPVCTKFLYD
jgi:hypothetical protein